MPFISILDYILEHTGPVASRAIRVDLVLFLETNMKVDRRTEFWKTVLAGTNLPNNDTAGRFGFTTKPLRSE